MCKYFNGLLVVIIIVLSILVVAPVHAAFYSTVSNGVSLNIKVKDNSDSGSSSGGGGGGGPSTLDYNRCSVDDLACVLIPRGTMVWDGDGKPMLPYLVRVKQIAEEPLLPDGITIIGFAYRFLPKGCTFDQPLAVTFQYDKRGIEDGINELDFVIAYYDETAGVWVVLPNCVVDVDTGTVTTLVEHFSIMAILNKAPAKPPIPDESTSVPEDTSDTTTEEPIIDEPVVDIPEEVEEEPGYPIYEPYIPKQEGHRNLFGIIFAVVLIIISFGLLGGYIWKNKGVGNE